MRNLTPLLAASGLLLACVDGAAPPRDGEDESALGDGKSDGSATYSACQLDAVVSWLNHGAAVDDLDVVIIDPDAAMNLAARRDGPDGLFGTEDDRPFRDAYDVDAVPFVGPQTFSRLVDAGAKICRDPTVEARDVDREFVRLPRYVAPPATIKPVSTKAYPNVSYRIVSMTGTYHPEVEYAQASTPARWCLQAMVTRYDQLMAAPLPGLDALIQRGVSSRFWLYTLDRSATTSPAPAEMDVAHPFVYFRPSAEPNGDCALPTRAHLDTLITRCTAYLATHANSTDCDD